MTLVRALYHEMVHVDQNFFTLINSMQREREAWEFTMARLVKWIAKLWAKYNEIPLTDTCARGEALEVLRSMIRVAKETHSAYQEKDYANFRYWWKERLAEVNAYSVKVETEMVVVSAQSIFRCISLVLCMEPVAIVGDPAPFFAEALEAGGLWMCAAELFIDPPAEPTVEPPRPAPIPRPTLH